MLTIEEAKKAKQTIHQRLGEIREEVENRLVDIMKNIHERCVKHGSDGDGFVNYVKGANVAGFEKVANEKSGRLLTLTSNNPASSPGWEPSRARCTCPTPGTGGSELMETFWRFPVKGLVPGWRRAA